MNAKEFIKKYAYQLEGFLDINQADTSRFHKAYLELSSDDRAFYDHENDKIHLGVTTFPVDEMFEELRHAFDNEVFNNGDIDVIEALYYMANRYLLGHEIQHKRSTRQKDFTAAQDGFIRSLYEEVSRYLKDGYTFRTDKDYDIYPEKLCSRGYLLDENVIRKMAHGIVNAIEDGRIERIRSLKKPGFAKYTSLFRSVIWMCDNSIDSFPVGEPGNKESLIIIINQALSLATSRVYQKGYLSKYGDTKLHRTVKLMVPFIKEGVFSSNSRGIVSPAMNIAKIIATYFINVASDSNGMSDLSKSMVLFSTLNDASFFTLN